MRLLQCGILCAALAIAPAAVLADHGHGHGKPDGEPPDDEDVCEELSGAAFGLCTAFCEAQDCPAHPDHPSCDELRKNFMKQTGLSTFPCENGALPTTTATATLTAGEGESATFTPTDTPTQTPPPATATSTQGIGIPVGTATATSTRTPRVGDVCAGLEDGAFGLCNAFCNAQNCPSHPDHPSCDELRENFEKQTGLSTFPCENAAGATATITPAPMGGHCDCDCRDDGIVTVDDLIHGVHIALGSQPMADCPHLIGRVAVLHISDLVAAVADALHGC
jgi:hypothetical protein